MTLGSKCGDLSVSQALKDGRDSARESILQLVLGLLGGVKLPTEGAGADHAVLLDGVHRLPSASTHEVLAN